jgi:hypothetical protein
MLHIQTPTFCQTHRPVDDLHAVRTFAQCHPELSILNAFVAVDGAAPQSDNNEIAVAYEI